MTKIFIKNPTSRDVGFLINKTAAGSFANSGPDGALVIKDRSVSNYLVPPIIPELGESHITEVIELEGKYVIQVENEIIPMIFDAEDIGKYFNEADDSNTGVAFVIEPEMITCVGGTSYLQLPRGLSVGPWAIELGGIKVASNLWDDMAIKNFFDANPGYGIVYEVFSSGSGSGAGVSEGIFINNNLTISYPLKITGPDKDMYELPKLNDTALVTHLENGTISIEACLNTYAELKYHTANLAITELDRFDDDSPISNDGLFLNITFPNGEVMDGFLAASVDGNSQRHEWDSIGKRADELGYSIGISFGGGSPTFNGGTLSDGVADISCVYINNNSNGNETWQIKGSAILGIYDINDAMHNGAVINGVGDISVTLGPYSSLSNM